MSSFKAVELPGEHKISYINSFVKYVMGWWVLVLLSGVVVVLTAVRFVIAPASADLYASLAKVWRPVYQGESLKHIFLGRD
jgi:hypothetical protein